ncbi:uncharacterized protein [Haliotis cracherodii]|uniref:uncharacterized protein n=1 Tax=Haliotis cracherodii TaxID=6455 RepID=UPI0039EB95DD
MSRIRVFDGPVLFVFELLLVFESALGYEYLLAQIDSKSTATIYAAASAAGGSWRIRYPHLGQEKVNRQLAGYGSDSFTIDSSMTTLAGVEYKSILVNTGSDSVNVHSHNGFSYFSPLPVTALGTTYILSSCITTNGAYKVLVVAAHSQRTTVQIRLTLAGTASVTFLSTVYRNGGTISQTLEPYQTLTLYADADLTGTKINADQNVAVFSGTYKVVYEQLLPVKHHGKEIVVAVDDNVMIYQLQIVGESSNTQITSNGVTSVLGADNRLQQTINRNDSLYITSNSAVMAMLCRRGSQYSGFLRIPPTSFYTKEAQLYHPDRCLLKILTTQGASDILVKQSASTLPIVWQNIAGSGYKVGTCVVPGSSSSTSITSTASKFTVLGYMADSVYNSGYDVANTGDPTVLNSPAALSSDNNDALFIGLICGLALFGLLFVALLTIMMLRRSGKKLRSKSATSRHTYVSRDSGAKEFIERPLELIERPRDLVVVERPREVIKRPREWVERPREVMERPREWVERPRELIERPRELIERPREWMERPREVIERPRELTERPREWVERPREVIERPREVMERTREWVERPREVMERPRELIERPMDANRDYDEPLYDSHYGFRIVKL